MSIMDVFTKTSKKVEHAIVGDDPGLDILHTLKQEHEEVQDLLKKLVEGESPAARKATLKKIKAALVPHSRAEEKLVNDAILTKDKQSKVDGTEGYIEHSLADKMLGNLGKITNAMSPEFTATAKVLKELIAHHIQEEESNVWADVRKHFSVRHRQEMNRKFLAAKKKIKVN